MKKQKEMVREFILLEIRKRPEQLTVEQLLGSIDKLKFELKSIVIAEGKQNHYFIYRIGLQTHDASKNTYKSKTKTVFPEVPDEDFSALATKGIGSWASSLCTQDVEVLHCSGELEKTRLFNIARQSNRKKSFSFLESPSKKAGQKRGKTVKYLFHVLYSFLWNTIKSIFRTTLNRVISLSVWFLFILYVFGYKDAGNLTTAILWHLKFKDIFKWLIAFRTPGFPPEWREVAAKPPSKTEQLINYINALSGFVSWVSSFLSNLSRLKTQIVNIYLWIKDRIP